MMQNHLFMAAILIFFATTLTLADDSLPASKDASRASKPDAANNNWNPEDGTFGQVLKQIKELRKELGPEFSIESKELGIERNHDEAAFPKGDKPEEEWSGTKLHQEVRELVSKFRRDARHLEEMAAQAEQLSEFALADQLREMAHRQWEAARELSKPRSAQNYHQPSQPTPIPAHTPPPMAPSPRWTPHEDKPPMTDIPAESSSAYGVPSAPNQRFSVPSTPKPRTR